MPQPYPLGTFYLVVAGNPPPLFSGKDLEKLPYMTPSQNPLLRRVKNYPKFADKQYRVGTQNVAQEME